MSAVTLKSTKNEIYKAYQDTLKRIKDTKQQTPRLVRETQHRAEVADKVAGIETGTIETSMNQLREAINQDLLGVSKRMQEQTERLEALDEQIKIKERDLKYVHDIEKEADTLAALIETRDQTKARFDEEQAEYKKEQALLKKMDEQTWARKREEAEYEFLRGEKHRQNALDDKLETKRRAWEGECEAQAKALDEREANLVEREKETTALETKVKTLETTFDERVAHETAQAEARLKRSNQVAEAMIRKDHEAKTTVLQGRLDSATSQLEHAAARINRLEEDLAQARTQVQQVALQALESKGSREMVAQIQSAVQNSTNSKK